MAGKGTPARPQRIGYGRQGNTGKASKIAEKKRFQKTPLKIADVQKMNRNPI
jgi:hypothetical protein